MKFSSIFLLLGIAFLLAGCTQTQTYGPPAQPPAVEPPALEPAAPPVQPPAEPSAQKPVVPPAQPPAEPPAPEPEAPAVEPAAEEAPLEATIHATEAGFEPATVTVKKGGKVTWVNDADAPSWPASAKHPTHTVYPGSGITQCGTDQQAGIFDACKGLAQGESFAFAFNEVGKWFFHDHLNPSHFGSVTVEE